MSANDPRTRRLRGDERAQTVQDFAVGISIFLLVVGAVFLLFPSLFAPYEAAIADEGPDSQADRIAMLIADNASDDRTANHLTDEEIEHWFDNGDFDDAVGVSSTTRVNVTLSTLGVNSTAPVVVDGSAAAAGPEPPEQGTSVASRIVTTDGPSCDPACRLVVRVW